MGTKISIEESARNNQLCAKNFPFFISEKMEEFVKNTKTASDLSVSFGYQCSTFQISSSEASSEMESSPSLHIQESNMKIRTSSFSCLSGAALSANATLANTNICNGLIGEEILPELDSPQSFKRVSSSASLSRLDLHSSPSPSENGILSAPTRVQSSSFLSAMDVQMAGGAAGEDRVQAVCSEENGWLFCGVYDGFNGRDAADYLAVTLYENIGCNLFLLECSITQKNAVKNIGSKSELSFTIESGNRLESLYSLEEEFSSDSFQLGVLNCLGNSLLQAENDFMYRVEQEMEDRPDLVSVGSCVLTVLLRGMDLYVMNLGDSRAVLATIYAKNEAPQAIQLTENHSLENEAEYKRILSDHPDDPSPIVGGRVKGKLKLTRAFGVGYLKKKHLNEALMGILRVRDLRSPPYVHNHPFTMSHKVSENDLFVVLGSDGLFDFFTNDEVVQLVHQYMQDNPFDDPAKHLIEQLVLRAAQNSGFSVEELMNIPVGRRRKYHDDVTVIVIILGNKQRTSTASTSL
ncbi:probable protein phosphatase 2C 39 isoform X1 [Zingiber officinale]|uniref:probable protein phosphatase 2C 39 isoform X1 n=1 Tax=Zingiber officinale TaxID=94328 RepID=UPI001C4C6C1D|nr:probable protein phosphatase 2C 39 isoform X1 [Zingiber officinale]XP_042388368.1 probable protein phosphatase 2C 39 isoform X1 [Zingiber officinale]